MNQDEIKRICLELMAPMVREFTKAVAEMREQGASDADIAAMLDMVETNGCSGTRRYGAGVPGLSFCAPQATISSRVTFRARLL